MSDHASPFNFGGYFTREKPKPKTGVYTGVLEKQESDAESLTLVFDRKGRAIAILSGNYILPFDTITVSDDLARNYASRYAKSEQGRILVLKFEKPKGRP